MFTTRLHGVGSTTGRCLCPPTRHQRERSWWTWIGTAQRQHPGSFSTPGVSSHDQRADLDRQVARLTEWATASGMAVSEVVTEVGSGMNGRRRKLARLLSDRSATTIVVEHRDRLARFAVEHLEAALPAGGRKVVVVDDGEVDDDLVREMTEVLTSFCARLHSRSGARNRAEKALRCAKADVGPTALSHPDASM